MSDTDHLEQAVKSIKASEKLPYSFDDAKELVELSGQATTHALIDLAQTARDLRAESRAKQGEGALRDARGRFVSGGYDAEL